MSLPSFEDVCVARERIRPYIHHTPAVTSATLDHASGARLWFKCENLQKVGAFKIRGACNAVFALSEAAAGPGVATHSSGNHGAALAQAAMWRGIPACVVMPRNAPLPKQRAVQAYGAEIISCEPGMQARASTLRAVVDRNQMTVVHPSEDPLVIAGQGTAVLELLEDVGELDDVIAPVGGGGLLSGTALACAAAANPPTVYAAEPENADDARRSFHAGQLITVDSPDTIADGLRSSLGPVTFQLIRELVADILTVSEAQIVNAMRLVWERMKLVIEPSAAVPVAAILARPDTFRGRRVGVILSGGNVDLDRLPW